MLAALALDDFSRFIAGPPTNHLAASHPPLRDPDLPASLAHLIVDTRLRAYQHGARMAQVATEQRGNLEPGDLEWAASPDRTGTLEIWKPRAIQTPSAGASPPCWGKTFDHISPEVRSVLRFSHEPMNQENPLGSTSDLSRIIVSTRYPSLGHEIVRGLMAEGYPIVGLKAGGTRETRLRHTAPRSRHRRLAARWAFSRR